jgi:ubiquinone/menaquinone biosynthesis C-methylase UbiE
MTQAVAAADYSDVTESPGNRVRREAIDMLWTRYAFAAELGAGKDILEVGSGPGPGLGYLVTRARRVVGGDCSEKLTRLARAHYGARVPILRLDGQALPFADASFDVVLLFEALYYLPDQSHLVDEARRVLRPQGRLVIVSVNPRWSDFNPSPFSTRYLDSEELRQALRHGGFEAAVLGAFRASTPTARARIASVVRRLAVQLDLVPGTMKGKELLKRIFYGDLAVFPAEIQPDMGAYDRPQLLAPGIPATDFKVLYAVGTKP